MHGNALRYFAEVAAAGSLSAASERLFVAVSAISRQISKLEAEVGATLFERGPRGMILSEAGTLLLAHARRTLLESEAVLHDIAGLKGAPTGNIRVVSSESLAAQFMPEVMLSFRAFHPHARFTLSVCAQEQGVRQVIEGHADVAVGFNAKACKGAIVRHAARAPVCAIMSEGHALARQAYVTLAQLTAYPLAVTETLNSPPDILENAAGQGFQPALVSNCSAALTAFVRNSERILLSGYVPVFGALERDGLVARPLTHPEMVSRPLLVQTMDRRSLPVGVEDFVLHLIAAIERLGPMRSRRAAAVPRTAEGKADALA
jgi:DNA-binding transcriptional LysR family regulator